MYSTILHTDGAVKRTVYKCGYDCMDTRHYKKLPMNVTKFKDGGWAGKLKYSTPKNKSAGIAERVRYAATFIGLAIVLKG